MELDRQAEALLAKISGLPDRTYQPGDTVIHEGEKPPGLLFLSSGTVDVVRDGIRVASIDQPGAIFGEMSLLLGSNATASVTARTVCTFKVAEDREEFLEYQFPQAALYVATILAHRLDSLTRYLVDIKRQFADRSDHLAMMDEILESIMNKHPRTIPRDDARAEEFDED